MEPDKKTPTDDSEITPTNDGLQAPADALSRTPDDLEDEQAQQAAANPKPDTDVSTEKKVSPVKKFFRKINLYFLMFLLIVVVAGIVVIVNFLNSQKVDPEPNIATQGLTESALKQLANNDTTVGNTDQTLTIQGNAVIAGQSLLRGNLNVAGNIQSGGSIQGPSLTISGQTNLGATQINTLQVATNTAIQGSTTMRDLSVSGSATFSGPLTASQITTSRLVLSGNAVLQIPNHLSFTGPTPVRGATSNGLGSGGTSSVSGSDTAGTVSINTGNNTVPGCFVRINFAQAFTTQPRVIISPIGAAAGQTQYYVDRNTSGFSICSSNAAPANQTFAFDYFIAG